MKKIAVVFILLLLFIVPNFASGYSITHSSSEMLWNTLTIQTDPTLNILYSGDINSQNTNLTHSANSDNISDIDTLIIESTYALKEHPPREKLEKEFVEKIINIIENGGRVLIPAFGVARSQEALLILEKFNYNGKIFIDGLARKISKLYLDNPDFLKNINLFKY